MGQVKKASATLNTDALTRASKQFNLPWNKGETPEEFAGRLAAKFAADGTAVINCGDCERMSPPDGKECPFCGVGDDEGTPPPEALVPPQGPPPQPEPAKATKLAKRVEATKLAKRVKDTAVKVEQGTMAKPEEAKAYADAVADLLRFKSNIRVGWWHMGKRLGEVEKSGVWRMKHASFAEFAQAEVSLAATTVKDAIDLARDYTEEQVRQFGASKLMLVMRAPTEDGKEKLLDSAKQGASLREMRAELGEQKAAHQAETGKEHVRDTGRGKGGGAHGGPKVDKMDKVAPKGRLTALWVEGKTYKAELLKKTGDLAKRKDLADKPSGLIEMNGTLKLLVTAYERVTDGAIMVSVKPVRTKE